MQASWCSATVRMLVALIRGNADYVRRPIVGDQHDGGNRSDRIGAPAYRDFTPRFRAGRRQSLSLIIDTRLKSISFARVFRCRAVSTGTTRAGPPINGNQFKYVALGASAPTNSDRNMLPTIWVKWHNTTLPKHILSPGMRAGCSALVASALVPPLIY